uniref:Uncharacterized protein n=1 Tax=Candidatus Kentrum sp. UNK TaxID=2126344 RepID=A0A451AWA0_9GAMM|nr:MAG: hypothetical protein BECKUNK1418H_GA0071006_10275 [Candidatus Kentron sp. UNK]
MALGSVPASGGMTYPCRDDGIVELGFDFPKLAQQTTTDDGSLCEHNLTSLAIRWNRW